jgi:hypothetical protein
MIIDNMGSFFRSFDDSLLEPRRMNSKIWFKRPVKKPCRVCNGPYLPHQDRQRYCPTCQEWLHVGCMDDGFEAGTLDYTLAPDHVPDPSTLTNEELLALCERVLEKPSVRGHGGTYDTYDWDNNWLNTGSGVQKGIIRRWKEEGAVPDDFVKELGENFLQDFLSKSWITYVCPTCGEQGI